MGQIVKRKKKGRPSKADLARRAAAAAEEQPEAAERRSFRRRSVRYTFDLDDYVDDDELEEDEEEEDEEAWRREKKLKLLLKVKEEGGSTGSAPSGTRRVGHAPAASATSSDYGGDSPLKKRKIEGHDEEYANGVDDDGVEEV